MWETVVPSLLDLNYKVLTIDLPCHGESRFIGDNCTMVHMAKEVVKLLNENEIEGPQLIGHSMGGYVGLEVLKLIQAKLILLHSNFWSDPEEKKQDRNRVIEVVKKNSSLFIQEAIPGLFAKENLAKCRTEIQSLIDQANKIPTMEIIAATAGIRDRLDNRQLMETNEIGIIQGAGDPVIPTLKMLEQTSTLKSQVEIVTIANSGHMSIWEDQDALIESIKRLLIE